MGTVPGHRGTLGRPRHQHDRHRRRRDHHGQRRADPHPGPKGHRELRHRSSRRTSTSATCSRSAATSGSTRRHVQRERPRDLRRQGPVADQRRHEPGRDRPADHERHDQLPALRQRLRAVGAGHARPRRPRRPDRLRHRHVPDQHDAAVSRPSAARTRSPRARSRSRAPPSRSPSRASSTSAATSRSRGSRTGRSTSR